MGWVNYRLRNFKAEFTLVNEHLKFHFSPEDAVLMTVPREMAE